mgnify:CR=1 FL=1
MLEDLLEDLEILITQNEDDFDRGGGKYILQQYINEKRKQLSIEKGYYCPKCGCIDIRYSINFIEKS